jgi:hypothetical protein
MSKERDLLKRWFSEFGRICCNKNLLIETKELLAKRQPLNLDISDFQRGYGAALTNAIYVKEPTRKPLSDSDIRTHTPFHYHDAEQKAFAVGVRWAEEQHWSR